MSELKVSIRLMTYNQEAYIRQAMDGIMMQQVSFPVEVVVGDDFSSDKTLDIIRTYASTKLIKINILERKKGDDYWIKRQQNGRLYNFENIIEQCSGRYIALLDGDDYWCDPLKLQKQADMLDQNDNLAMVHTGHMIYIDSKDKLLEVNKGILPEPSHYFEALLNRSNISTPTVMVRSEIIKKAIQSIKDNIRIHKIMDYPVWLEIASRHAISFMKDITAVYRLVDHSESRPKTIQKKYDYIENVYQIKKRFIEIYGVGKDLSDTIELAYLRKRLFYAFTVMDAVSAEDAFRRIYNKARKLNLNDRLKMIGAKNRILNKGLSLFLHERNMI